MLLFGRVGVPLTDWTRSWLQLAQPPPAHKAKNLRPLLDQATMSSVKKEDSDLYGGKPTSNMPEIC